MKVKTIQVWYVQYVGPITGKPQVKVCYTYASAKEQARRLSNAHRRMLPKKPVDITGPFDHTVAEWWTP